MKVKTSELQGAALDWAVAVALDWKIERPQDGQFIDNEGNRWLAGWRQYAPKISFSPSTSWAQAGPLRDKYRIDILDFSEDDEPMVSASYLKGNGLYSIEADAALVAICRVVVAINIGDVVEVPDELVKELL